MLVCTHGLTFLIPSRCYVCSGRHPVAVRALSDESEGEDSDDDDDMEMEAPVDAEEVWPVSPYRWTTSMMWGPCVCAKGSWHLSHEFTLARADL